MRRSKWKKITDIEWNIRSHIINIDMENEIIEVPNGKTSKLVKISEEHIGHRLGEFSDSKRVAKYKRKK